MNYLINANNLKLSLILIYKLMFDIISLGDNMKSVYELKLEIDKIMKYGYKYNTNLSWSENLVSINHGLCIGAKLVKTENEIIYEFIVDTQFNSSKEISFDEICMCKDIIEIFEKNKNFILKRLKKYTVEEYEQEQVNNKIRQEEMMKFLESIIFINKTSNKFKNDKIVANEKIIEKISKEGET